MGEKRETENITQNMAWAGVGPDGRRNTKNGKRKTENGKRPWPGWGQTDIGKRKMDKGKGRRPDASRDPPRRDRNIPRAIALNFIYDDDKDCYIDRMNNEVDENTVKKA